MSAPLLDVRALTVDFDVGHRRSPVRAVDDVSFQIAPGETLGMVGESGSGKTTIGRAILGLVPVKSGEVRFDAKNIHTLTFQDRRRLSRDLQVVFQDPYSSLNPTRTVGQTLGETVAVHERLSRSELQSRVQAMLNRVGLPVDAAERYPAHFSGGQRQRIAIARALIVRPRLVICDEPVSALDLSVQAQVLNLLRELQQDLGLSYLFVAHDLHVVRYLSHRIVVLYRGRVMEQGDAEALYRHPSHPYTRALLDSAPTPDPQEQRRRPPPKGHVQGFASQVTACAFAPRCPLAVHRCTVEQPMLERTPEGAFVACHRWRDARSDEGVVERARVV